MSETVDAIWQRAHAWLDANAPEGRRWLSRPAPRDRVARAEADIAVAFPDEVRASLAIHDGQERYTGPLFDGFRLITLDEIVDKWRIMVEVAGIDLSPPFPTGDLGPDVSRLTIGNLGRGLPGHAVRSSWADSAWIPIAEDEGHNTLVIDLNPAPGGVRGQLICVYIDHPDRPRLATSFAAFLAQCVDDWEAGRETIALDEDGTFDGFDDRHRSRPGM